MTLPLAQSPDATAQEVRAVLDAARAADRLLAVDYSYRFTEGMRRIRELVCGGELGRVYAADLVFHNASGPDKAWFYDRTPSGGGCVADLGVHMVDLALHKRLLLRLRRRALSRNRTGNAGGGA